MRIILLFTCILLSLTVVSQTNYLSAKGLNRLMNKSFGNLATGQSNTSEITNSASFDAAAGSFSFKAVMPVHIKKDSANISYLSIKAEGDLISDSYSSLFKNSKLNTGVSIQLEYNVRPWKGKIYNLRSDRYNMKTKRAGLDFQYNSGLEKIELDIANKTTDSLLIASKYNVAVNKLNKLRTCSNNVSDSIRQGYNFTGASLNYDSLGKYTDSLSKIASQLKDIITDSINMRISLDSIQRISPGDIRSIRTLLQRKVLETYQSKMIELETNPYITAVHFAWLTFYAGTVKKDFFTYDESLAFNDQIKKEELQTFRLGFSYNLFHQDYFNKTTFYFNIGLEHLKDNNTALLSTKEINQERTITDTSSNTVRTISKKYQVFTDSIEQYNLWNIYSNFYYLVGNKTFSGLHFFPSFNIRDDKKNIINFGIGFVGSFVNAKKDKPVINAEGYIEFIDLFNKLDGKPRFWNRNEIGIRFTLPFSLLVK